METERNAPDGRIHPHAVIRALEGALRTAGQLIDDQNAGVPRDEAWGATNAAAHDEALALCDRYRAQEGAKSGEGP